MEHQARNVARANMIKRLADGEWIEGYRESGNSMTPIIRHRQPITLAPIVDPSALRKGDIVFARVKSRHYTHLIHAVGDGKVLIGNNHGHMNGWARLENVYGIVTAVDGVYRRNSQHSGGAS